MAGIRKKTANRTTNAAKKFDAGVREPVTHERNKTIFQIYKVVAVITDMMMAIKHYCKNPTSYATHAKTDFKIRIPTNHKHVQNSNAH